MTSTALRLLRARILDGVDVTDATAVATAITAACSELSRQAGDLVGDLGGRALFERAIHLASRAHPIQKRTTKTRDELFETLRSELAGLDASAAADAGFGVFGEFATLLERFIGHGLVENQLNQLWPGVFDPGGNKEHE